ncbi:hypothetical protein DSO57_1028335 [Entomophthora muscae]|uniref:Uncharacterized protein n=1 Tax=Entomophthora muscae TaxID=34485 RepID=A0ACC2TDQ8_9FUNG|nr:hypothetical protein DSO57_1028335 [Entomophthora muscae]
MQKPVNKEFLISFDVKPASSPDTDNEELAASDSNQLTFQNNFKALKKEQGNLKLLS